MSHKPPKGIHCPAGEWTRVELYVGSKQHITKFYEADPANVAVQFRIYSSWAPPYQDGTFDGLLIKTMPVARTWLVKFNPAEDVDVISGLTSPEQPPNP
jgi:hypothetical protein